MTKIPRIFLTLLISVAAACGPLRSVRVQAPPQYADGVPSDLHYEKLAERTQEMALEGTIPDDPAEAYRVALALLEERGVQVVPKATSGSEQWDAFTTAFPKTILVATDWNDLSETARATVLWHELVHLRQYEEHGELLMGLMYVTAEGRWSMEVQAYRESFRVKRVLGESEDLIREGMKRRAASLYNSYELGAMPREYAINKAVEIWMLDSI